MQEIAALRRRFGYRRIGLLLERRGMLMNRIRRLRPIEICGFRSARERRFFF